MSLSLSGQRFEIEFYAIGKKKTGFSGSFLQSSSSFNDVYRALLKCFSPLVWAAF